jgi:hypothetical protein
MLTVRVLVVDGTPSTSRTSGVDIMMVSAAVDFFLAAASILFTAANV